MSIAEDEDDPRVDEYRARDARYVNTVLRAQEQHASELTREKSDAMQKFAAARDMLAAQTTGRRRAAMGALPSDPYGAVYGSGYAGYGNGTTGPRPILVLPRDRKMPRARRDFRPSRRQRQLQAQAPEILVPIRIDVDTERWRLKDTLTWNVNESTCDFKAFADTLCRDMCIPANSGMPVAIVQAMMEQVQEFYPHNATTDNSTGMGAGVAVDTADPQGMLGQRAIAETYIRPDASSEISQNTLLDQDLRIQVKIDVTVGSVSLQDSFEWDLSDPNNDPEAFARCLCRDLGLDREFETAVAHEIREQTQIYTKSLFLVGYAFDGSEIEDAEVRSFQLPTITSGVRARELRTGYSPIVVMLDEDALDRSDREQDRESRRKKRRQVRATKRGAALPGLGEAPRTHRTPMVHSVLTAFDPLVHRFGVVKPLGSGDDRDTDSERMVPVPAPVGRPPLSSYNSSNSYLHQQQQARQQRYEARNTPVRRAAKSPTPPPSLIVTLRVPTWKLYRSRASKFDSATSFRRPPLAAASAAQTPGSSRASVPQASRSSAPETAAGTPKTMPSSPAAHRQGAASVGDVADESLRSSSVSPALLSRPGNSESW